MSIIGSTDFPIDPAVTSGSDLAGRLNRFAAAYSSNNLNSTRPPSVAAGGLWTRDNTNGSKDLFLYNGAADVLIAGFNADNTLNTDAIGSNLSDFRGYLNLAASTTLTYATHAERVLACALAGSVITLPAANTCKAGTRIFLSSHNSGNVTVNCAGSDLINLLGTGTSASITLGSRDNLELISNGVSAWVIGACSTALQYSGAAFAKSLLSNGYQKLPGGLILQWGTSSTPASGLGGVTFPITFPSAVLIINCQYNNMTTIPVIVAPSGGFGTTGFNAKALRTDTSAAASVGFIWTALGI